MNVKWEDVKEDFARKDAEIEALKAMNSKLENSLERVLNAVEAKKPAVQYDALVAMNAELVEALEGLLWGVDLETTDIPYTCISTANHALAKAKELSQ